MPAYNFKVQFALMVEDGRKHQTIRCPRKRPTVAGDILYLYTGMRTKDCRKLGEAVCTSVESVGISEAGIFVNDIWLSYDNILMLANDDGFNSTDDFHKFFKAQYGLPVELELIRW